MPKPSLKKLPVASTEPASDRAYFVAVNLHVRKRNGRYVEPTAVRVDEKLADALQAFVWAFKKRRRDASAVQRRLQPVRAWNFDPKKGAQLEPLFQSMAEVVVYLSSIIFGELYAAPRSVRFAPRDGRRYELRNGDCLDLRRSNLLEPGQGKPGRPVQPGSSFIDHTDYVAFARVLRQSPTTFRLRAREGRRGLTPERTEELLEYVRTECAGLPLTHTLAKLHNEGGFGPEDVRSVAGLHAYLIGRIGHLPHYDYGALQATRRHRAS